MSAARPPTPSGWLRLGAAAAVALLGCGASPEPTYYALAPTTGAARSGATHMIELRRPGLAGYLDRSDIVRRVSDYRLTVASAERWGEPLGDMIARVLAEDLAQRLPGSIVFTEAAAVSAVPDATVEMDIQRFDLGADGAVSLAAQIAVERGREREPGTTTVQSVELRSDHGGAGTPWLAGEMSALLGRLADSIAAMLRG
jgi:hypothetical protein